MSKVIVFIISFVLSCSLYANGDPYPKVVIAARQLNNTKFDSNTSGQNLVNVLLSIAPPTMLWNAIRQIALSGLSENNPHSIKLFNERALVLDKIIVAETKLQSIQNELLATSDSDTFLALVVKEKTLKAEIQQQQLEYQRLVQEEIVQHEAEIAANNIVQEAIQRKENYRIKLLNLQNVKPASAILVFDKLSILFSHIAWSSNPSDENYYATTLEVDGVTIHTFTREDNYSPYAVNVDPGIRNIRLVKSWLGGADIGKIQIECESKYEYHILASIPLTKFSIINITVNPRLKKD